MSEVLKEALTETGGILLGYRNGSEWIVVESIDPGPNSIFEVAYFEYDQPYVMHLANRVRNYYDPPLELLGLWHRHPGSFDRFSGTDDETNRSFASLSPVGAISGLINIDPHCRFTLYRVDKAPLGLISYTRIPYSNLNAEDSERIAPLRDVDKLASEIEQRQEFGRASAQGASLVLSKNCADLSDVAKQVHGAIARCQNEQPEKMLTADARAEWTDEQIEGVLEALGSDIAFFGMNSIELCMKLLDEKHIELSVRFEGQEQPLCVLVLASALQGGNATACMLDNQDSAVALPYEPGFFRQCLSSKPTSSDVS